MTQEHEPETTTSSAADEVDDQLRALEHERCRAISELDIATLQRLLDDDLSHTHVNGMTQDRLAYLVGLANRPRSTSAGFIRVRRHGDVAILSGTLTNSFTAADGSPRDAELHALRVWRRDGGDWRLLAFAASGPLAPRPPESRDG
jgi:ketosteroid isomerase-like protein